MDPAYFSVDLFFDFTQPVVAVDFNQENLSPTFIGHGFAGLAVGALFSSRASLLRAGFLCLLCSIIPDFDSIGFRLGIPYQHWLGHRGFTHSIVFAVLLALLASLFISGIEKSLRKRAMLFTAFFISVLLHDILDAMTNGGLGVAFFSPFSDQRFFLPWRPIEVSPISLNRFFTSRGLTVVKSELFWVIVPSLCVAVLSFIGKKRYRNYASAKLDRAK